MLTNEGCCSLPVKGRKRRKTGKTRAGGSWTREWSGLAIETCCGASFVTRVDHRKAVLDCLSRRLRVEVLDNSYITNLTVPEITNERCERVEALVNSYSRNSYRRKLGEGEV